MAPGAQLAAAQDLDWDGLRIAGTGLATLSLSAAGEVTGLGVGDLEATDLTLTFGAAAGAARWGKRAITATAVMAASEEARSALRTAMLPGPTPRTLAWRGHGWDGDRLVWATPRRCSGVSTRESAVGRMWRVDLQWVAVDPRIYSLDEVSVALDETVGHEGTVDAPWRARLTGPVASPEIRRGGMSWRWPTITLTAGQHLDIDMRARTAVVGDIDVWGLAVDDNGRVPVEWGIPPSGVEIEAAAAEATLWVRDTWL